MRFLTLATDYDGTLAKNGRVSAEALGEVEDGDRLDAAESRRRVVAPREIRARYRRRTYQPALPWWRIQPTAVAANKPFSTAGRGASIRRLQALGDHLR
ncbi:MAG TPA: hypothetical protein VNH11_30410 [Pirellulales bacterium]|nr:hypothetical protein [Pirellulales bacterium]